ncbi:hypothetical protein BH09BAC2_BH09BAC2_11630 [soil metagenome]
MKTVLIFFATILFYQSANAQLDTAFIKKLKSLDTLNTLKTDTIAVLEDRLTKKIRVLRRERSGFDINFLIQMKLAEEQAKDTIHSKSYYLQLTKELTTGRAGRLIENSLINIYRKLFTEREIDQMISFYKTSAGKKMSKEFIYLVLRSSKNAEQLMKLLLAVPPAN